MAITACESQTFLRWEPGHNERQDEPDFAILEFTSPEFTILEFGLARFWESCAAVRIRRLRPGAKPVARNGGAFAGRAHARRALLPDRMHGIGAGRSFGPGASRSSIQLARVAPHSAGAAASLAAATYGAAASHCARGAKGSRSGKTSEQGKDVSAAYVNLPRTPAT